VDENEYRDAYQRINPRRCLFEKAINSRRATCARGQRFHLADREGIACTDDAGQARCAALLPILRRKALFALKITDAPGPLPHAKEMKVQIGGMLGVQQCLHPERSPERVEDIDGLAREAGATWGEAENWPWTEIVKSVVGFDARRRRR